MTLKDAIIKSLDNFKGAAKYQEVLDIIKSKNYYDFGAAKHLAQLFPRPLVILSGRAMCVSGELS
jgi:hypothetical protein